MSALPDEPKGVYRSKNGKSQKSFDALEWLAAMCYHAPNKSERRVRFYGQFKKSEPVPDLIQEG